MTLTLISLLILALLALSLIYWTIKLGIGPTPTSSKVQATLQEMLPESVSGDVVELGSGWGQLLKVLVKRYPKNKVIGYERSPIPFYYSKCFFKKASIRKQNFFREGFSDTGLLVCYLYPKAMHRVEQEIVPLLPEGSWIVTHTFALPGLTPVRVGRSNDLYRTPVYLYQKA